MSANLIFVVIVITFILALIVWVIYHVTSEPEILPPKISDDFVFVYTANGPSRLDRKELANELDLIKSKLQYCKELDRDIENAIRDIKRFVKVSDKTSPYTKADSLCDPENLKDFEERLNIWYNLTPNYSSDPRLSETDMVDDCAQPTGKEKFNYLLHNIDILVALLRRNVCRSGKLDMNALYNILNKIRYKFGCSAPINDNWLTESSKRRLTVGSSGIQQKINNPRISDMKIIQTDIYITPRVKMPKTNKIQSIDDRDEFTDRELNQGSHKKVDNKIIKENFTNRDQLVYEKYDIEGLLDYSSLRRPSDTNFPTFDALRDANPYGWVKIRGPVASDFIPQEDLTISYCLQKQYENLNDPMAHQKCMRGQLPKSDAY